MNRSLSGKVILVTGGTGSFGTKFTEVVLKEHSPSVIRVFSRGELLQSQMQRMFDNDHRLRFFIGDVRDKDRLRRAMNGADVVVHAAALKQILASEYNPIEAIRTNIDGAINVIEAAIDNEVERVVTISTDKAVYPVNTYGATKLVAEKLFIQGNVYAGARRTRFSVVRYGNVVGSRGSVVPLFLDQRSSGRVTITDERMTRFWITLEQGVRFTIDCIGRMKGGEIFVPKVPSVKIIDLADILAPEARREITGIRPGEKIHEFLLTEEEIRRTEEFDGYFIVKPEHPFWGLKLGGGKSLPEGFRYESGCNSWQLTKKDIKEMLLSQDEVLRRR